MSYHRLQNQLYLDPCGFLLRLRLQAGLAVLQGALSFALFLLSITDTLKKPPADPAIGADGGSGCRSSFNRTTGDSFFPFEMPVRSSRPSVSDLCPSLQCLPPLFSED